MCTLGKQVWKIENSLKEVLRKLQISHLMTIGKSCFLKRRYLWTSFRSQRHAHIRRRIILIYMIIVADTKMFSGKKKQCLEPFSITLKVKTKCKKWYCWSEHNDGLHCWLIFFIPQLFCAFYLWYLNTGGFFLIQLIDLIVQWRPY